MAREIRPFKFGSLERWTRPQLRVLETLQAYLPASPFTPGFKDKLRATLQPYLNCDLDVWLDAMLPTTGEAILKQLPRPTLVAVLGMPPETHKILVEFDVALASMCVDRVLGGKGEDGAGQTPLTEIEQGVFAFLVLKVLQLVRGEWGDEARTSLKLEAFRSSGDTLIDDVKRDADYFTLGFKLFFDLSVGFARLYLPEDLIASQFSFNMDPDGPVALRRRRHMREAWQRLDGVRAPLVVEAGRSELTPDDVANLEVGDIILIEETGLALDGDALSGTVRARLGAGSHGVIEAEVHTDDHGRLQLSISDIVQVGEPGAVEADSDDEEAEEEDEVRGSSGRTTMSMQRRADRIARALAAQGLSVAAHERDPGAPDRPVDDDLDDLRDGTQHDDDEDEEEYEEGEEEEEEEDEEEGAEEEEEEEEGAEPDNLRGTENLLNDLSVHLVVELGRVKMSASEVVNLRTGMVLELKRAPHDPVDLVVQNRLIGKGELVEVEGSLGVRMISLVKG